MPIEIIGLHPEFVSAESDVKFDRTYRSEISLTLDLPEKLEGLTQADLLDIKNTLSEVRFIEYDSGRPGPLIIITTGMHGEETLGDAKNTIEDLDDRLRPQVLNLTSGSLILVPNLNSRGCQSKTRYVFSDERETNLNNIFQHFQAGSGNEFEALPTRSPTPKTALYGWLLMKYIDGKAKNHQEKYGSHRPVFLFDLHREERAIPQLAIDRFDEDPVLQAGLINGIRSLEIPAFLSYSPTTWKMLGYDQILSAAAVRCGMLGYTIEEGRTYHADNENYLYVSLALLRFLRKLKVVSGPQDIWDQLNSLWKQLLVKSPLQKTQVLWQKQHDKGELDMIYDQAVKFESRSGATLSRSEFLNRLVSSPGWDGIISVEFLDRLRGTAGENTSIHIADVSVGRKKTNRHGKIEGDIDMFLTIPRLAEHHYLISLHESSQDLGHDGVVYFALIPIKSRRNKIVGVRLIRVDSTTDESIILGPRELNRLIKKTSLEIDLDELDIVCAGPDKLWDSRLQKGKLVLFPRRKQVFP